MTHSPDTKPETARGVEPRVDAGGALADREALKQEDDRSLPTYGQIPWKQLGRDVMDAIYGSRKDYEFKDDYYPGHQMVPQINFNSLARIIDKYRWYGVSRTTALPAAGEVREAQPQCKFCGAVVSDPCLTMEKVNRCELPSFVERLCSVCHKPFIAGDDIIVTKSAMHRTCALALPQSKDARTVPGEAGREALPAAWIVLSEETGNTRIWWGADKTKIAQAWAERHKLPLIPLYRSPSVTGAGAMSKEQALEYINAGLRNAAQIALAAFAASDRE